MNEEEKKRMKELEDSVAALTKQVGDKEAQITILTKEVETQKNIIEQKNKDIVGARKEYKKLADMTQEEKDALSEAEKDLIMRSEAHEAEVAQFKKEQDERNAKEVASRVENAIKKYAGTNADLVKKIKDNLALIKDSDKAQTEEEVSKLVGTAWNMLGDEKPKPVLDAMGNEGIAPGDTFSGATSPERITALEQSLGITPPPAPDAGAGK